MIPSLVVSDIRAALVEFLASTFSLADDAVRDELTRFLEHPTDGIFRGPFLKVSTPFRAVDQSWTSPLDWMPDWFVPYQHQATAFERLSTANGHEPEPTLVTTGTGSGKTECFLLPMLDHCVRQRAAGAPGIKALILYPMNALASDQAGRIAELIHNEPALAGLRAGLYVGESGSRSTMGEDHLIDKRETLRNDPPDILLTNYKMLDFLLLRREDRNLWAANEPDTLRYVVLDEFHTYDGAQGTDVAMLLRRLGRTLRMNQPDRPLGSAAPVATSATLGTGPAAVDELCGFASRVFGSEFDASSVVGETRQTVEEATDDLDYLLPIAEIDDLNEADDDLDAVAAAFCRRDADDDAIDPGNVVELGERLLQHPLTRAVLGAVGNRSRSWPEALSEINTRAPNWGRATVGRSSDVERALGRFLWLLSLARRQQGERLRPLFQVEVQLWVREVSRLLRTVEAQPSFRWLDSAAPESAISDPSPSGDDEPDGPTDNDGAPGALELPAIYCRRCGQSGWRVLASEVGTGFIVNTATIYQQSVKRSANVRDLILVNHDDPDAVWFDPFTRTVSSDRSEGAVSVLVSLDEDHARQQRCPSCGDTNSIRFLGLQVASLASVALNTLFGSPHLEADERKLLAFTDSVQDASHRAAFFAGRTHRFNLRTRMVDVIKARGDVTLDDLGDELFNNAITPHDRFSTVPPDLMRDRAIASVWSDTPDLDGLDLLRRRLGFEVDIEFGLRSRVGRTLELSRVAVAAVDLDGTDEVIDLLREELERLVDGAPADALAAVDVYLRGLLERLRLQGGLAHPLLQPYLDEGGQQWFVWGGRPAGLPPFARGQGRPIFATSATNSDFDSVATVGTTKTWVLDWACRVLGVEPHVGQAMNLRAMSLLASETSGVTETNSTRGTVWALERRAVRVWDVADDHPDDPTTAAVRCGLCGSRHPIPPHQLGEWVASPCMRYRCVGTYEADAPRLPNYYRTLYRGGATRRVVTAEHTGGLARDAREQLERAFKSGAAPDDPNVITATPTLEMGIDIGDLSAVMLTSVPRNPASYVQRVGRAGRLNGNSLITTFVRTDTHGLYYLSDPDAMISGEVRPPNCYLDAVETLQRQYIAYVLDRMADLTIDADPLPNKVSAVMANAFDDGALLRRVIDASILDPDLVDEFLALFGAHLDDTSREALRGFAAGGIERTIKSAVDTWNGEQHQLDLRRKRLTGAIIALEEKSQRTRDDDDNLVSLGGQRAAIIKIRNHLRNEYVLSALERIGLLPNYLLLGDTATLRATLWSRNDNNEFATDTLEYTRSARLALREFAPGNSFYAAGHKHVIDALEIGSADEPLYERWRLCPDCGHAQIEKEGEPPPGCPRCGGTSIADIGASHRLLRLTSAIATSSEEVARVYDESDERDRESYEVTTLIDIDTAYVSGAWALPETAFGVERCQQAKLRTLNLGFTERPGQTLPIGGDPEHVSGFSVCRYCGSVREVRDDRQGEASPKMHLGWCKVRSGKENPQWDSVKLLHELSTEAIRILLPVSMFEIEERLASFTGALILGLREDFGGDPDHLEVERMHMPNRGGQGDRQFLVLYDRVPGGTGYLARLADPDRMHKILLDARRVISHCICRNEGRRACHRCLLGAVNQRDYPLVGRDLALDVLDTLLTDWNPASCATVSGIDIAGVEESELERRFKVAVRAWAEHKDNPGVTFRAAAGQPGREAFELIFSRPSSEHSGSSDVIRYRIDEQAGLGTTPSTIPDFRIARQDADGPEIAVYCDGYQFHASVENNNLAADAEKREGVRASGRLVWNLTWNDVEDFHQKAQHEDLRRPPVRRVLTPNATGAAQRALHRHHVDIDLDVIDSNPLELLMSYLANPDLDAWGKVAAAALTGVAADSGAPHPVDSAAARQVIESSVTGVTDFPMSSEAPTAVAWQWVSPNDLGLTVLLRSEDPAKDQWTAVLVLPDDNATVASLPHRQRWRDWLQWANIVQFVKGYGRDVAICARSQGNTLDIDDFWIVHVSETSDAAPSDSPPVTVSAENHVNEPSPDIELSEDQEDELDLIEAPQVADLIAAALRRGAPDFIAGHEIAGQPVEAGWPNQKVAVHIGDDVPVTPGWTIRDVGNWTLPELLIALGIDSANGAN